MSDLDRYARQMKYAEIGEEGQRRLRDASVLLVGCGALGTVLAETLVRAGVGRLRVVDRDFVELTNLQRQVLFDEEDLAAQLPKAVAAAQKLRKINSQVVIEPVVEDVSARNVLRLAEGMQLLLDGTDNFETRFLLNDVSLETGIPWVYGGCIGSHGQTLAILPGETACLRCLMETAPPPGTTETCDTAGILGPTVNIVASLQAVSALKILSGRRDALEPALLVVDVWDGTLRKMSVRGLKDQGGCVACAGGARDWLRGERGSQTTALCGRNAVQVAPSEPVRLSLEQLEAKLRGVGTVRRNPYLLKLSVAGEGYELTVFPDGRAIIQGTNDVGVARGVYSRYVGG